MDRIKEYYQSIAGLTAQLSSARLSKVGAIIVKNGSIISFGYNRTLPGHDNNCEIETLVTDDELIKSLWDYLLEFPRKRESESDSAYYNKHFWYKEKCYVCKKVSPGEILNGGIPIGYRTVIDPNPSYEFFYELTTKPEVIHAEQNALFKLIKSHESAEGATMYITHAPCKHCVNAIIMSGIVEVNYSILYKNNGICELQMSGIEVNKIPHKI